MKGLLAVLVFIITLPGHALTLEEYLAQVSGSNKSLRSLQKSQEAATYRRISGDLELSPTLSLQAQKIDDKKPTYFGTLVMDRTQTTAYSLGLGKKFFTGTRAQIDATTGESTIDFTNLSPVSTGSQTLGTSSLGISLSQSLWKNAFGSATRLREAHDLAIEAHDRQSFNLQQKQLLIEAESTFWDYLYYVDELAQRKASLDRSKKIENWIRRRVGNGISDNADLYNAQGLVALRELQLLAAQDQLIAAEKKIREQLELPQDAALPSISGDLSAKRGLEQMTGGNGRRKVRLDSYLAVLDAKSRAISAQETEDTYRPDLTLEGSYRTNAVEPTMNDANRKISNTDTPTSTIALKFTWLLDGDLKDAARQTSKSESLAAALRQEHELLASDSSWSEMNRRHEELTKQIKQAEIVSELQTKKADAQRDKLTKGRSITSDVITAEEDASAARLTLAKLRAEQRKLEAQGRLFVTMEE